MKPKRTELELSVLIPVYGSADTVHDLYDRLVPVLRELEVDYEIVFVDDASPDGAWTVLSDMQESDPEQVTIVQLMRNFGQHNALMCGFRHTRGKYIVPLDDDLQHPPEEIPKLLHAIQTTGDDVVYGVPESRRHKQWRNLGSKIVASFYRVVFKSRVQPSAFRVVRREAIEAILSYSLDYTYIDGLLAWNTTRISQIQVGHEARATGRSGYSLGKLLVLAFNLFTNFSLLPLQFVSLLGLLAACGGLATGAYYLAKYLLVEITVPGYASTIIAVLVLGGLQLLAMGVMGEYLGRLHLNVNRKPQYTIREVRGASPKPEDGSVEQTGASSDDWETVESEMSNHRTLSK